MVIRNNTDSIWVYGVPSGEAIQLSKKKFDELYLKNYFQFSVEYIDTGFFIFDDKNINEIKKQEYKDTKNNKDIIIRDNEFKNDVIFEITNMINQYPMDAELYVQEYIMGISYGNYYIEIILNFSKYKLSKSYNGIKLDEYIIPNELSLYHSIHKEMYLK